ncbi:hypothetical protein NRIC_07670 [Enterococcus florum]|uniref:Gram-positive cocci surface proteins LPxTG domain-containing protein n=1 Tax=Enterococcus florum TaxID=2480627 RepID=A0A4P5P5Z6_9ENTE|nr:LPXTG cell wall anchor domain-containing protein [Enterococcus florum]GCF92876.1 hypothetical protein NRIC_07670 [Enterococcus florum]
MKKIKLFLAVLLTFLIAGITASPAQAIEDTTVEVLIHTKIEGGEKVQGTEDITFMLYDITSWCKANNFSEKAAKEFLLDKFSKTGEMQEFLESEDLEALNETPIGVDAQGVAKTTVDRYQNDQEAAYLILASGETGNYRFLPVVLFPAQLHTMDTMVDSSEQLMVYGKYLEIEEPAPSEPTPSSEEEPRTSLPRTQGVTEGTTTRKTLPQTNDVVTNYLAIGGLLLILGILGLRNNTKKIRGNE